ncbi:MAG: hypothetical protein HY665_00140 [Chloroflexi bacterium]|nr:hypothetical protein [Chloroflexota bacterium]
MTYIDEFRQIMPSNILAVACDLKHTGSADLAWRCDDVKVVLATLRARGRIILGGDVYSIIEGEIDATWDAWFYEPNAALSQEANSERSYEAALGYIESYHKKHGEDFCYSVVFR